MDSRHPVHSKDIGPQTLASGCSHRPPCPGCPRFGKAGIARAAHEALEDAARSHGLAAVTVISGAATGFRLRARLAIRGRVNSPKLGLFELGTHHVVHIPHCQVQHPLINRVAGVVRRALVDAGITSWSDKAHLGVARYLQVVVERESQSAQVVLVANAQDIEPLSACFALIREGLGDDLHSLWFNANRDPSNTILGSGFERSCGPGTVVEHFGGAAVHYPPGAFGQSNLEIAQAIIDHVRAAIPHGSRVTEFYAGVGAIGLSVLDRVRDIRMNEVSPQSLLGLSRGIEALEETERSKVTVVPGTAGAARDAVSEAQVVIADPPRKGLDRELTEHLVQHAPELFLYVSCGLESFLEDAARLTAGGTLRLAALTAFNLMPYTEHVETLARFERVQGVRS